MQKDKNNPLTYAVHPAVLVVFFGSILFLAVLSFFATEEQARIAATQRQQAAVVESVQARKTERQEHVVEKPTITASPVAFQVVFESTQFHQKYGEETKHVFIGTQETYDEVWNGYLGVNEPQPSINFDTHQAIFLYGGVRGSTQDTVRFSELSTVASELKVGIEDVIAGDGCRTDTQVGYPSQLVLFENPGTFFATFRRSEVVEDCV